MKILLVGKPWKGGLLNYLYATFDALAPGCAEWIATYPTNLRDKLLYRQNKREWRIGLVEKIKKTPYDAAIFVNLLEVFTELPFSEKNILWLTDDPRSVAPFLAPFGRVFITDPGYEEEFLCLSGRENYAGVLTFGFLSSLRTGLDLHRKPGTRGFCFIGNRDTKRTSLIESLLDENLPLVVYGNYFLAQGPFWRHPFNFRAPISFQRMGDVYSRFRASLNIHARVVRQGTNMRTFECAGYGIPQIVENRPGLEELFSPEEEILVFNDLDELLAQADRLLHDEKLCLRLAANARRRVFMEHTYEYRIRTLLGDLVSV